MSKQLLGIDIGGTKCAVVLGDDQGRIIDRTSFPTRQELGPEQAIEQLLIHAASLFEKHRAAPDAIGVACGSPLDPDRGVVMSPPNLPTWVDVPIVEILRSRFRVPTFLDNDANAGAIAEYIFGAGRGVNNMVFITFGTGCGAGMILNGRIYRGANCYAGEVGHIRLAADGPLGYHKRGSFEGFCSGGGIAQLAAALVAAGNVSTCLSAQPTAEEVAKAAANGDPLAISIFETSGYYLGKGISYLLDIINPERIVIGSIFVRCEKYLRPSMQRAIDEEALEQTRSVCEVLPAGLGERVGDVAALAVASYGLSTERTA